MAFMTLLLYLSCFFYTLALPSDYHAQLHVLCKIYLALQLYFYVMFFLSEIKFLYLASCILYLSRRLLLMESYIIKWSNLDTCSVHIAIATQLTLKILKSKEILNSILELLVWWNSQTTSVKARIRVPSQQLVSYSFYQSSVVVTAATAAAAAAANDAQMEEWYLSDNNNKLQVSMYKMYSSAHIPIHDRLTKSTKVDVYLRCQLVSNQRICFMLVITLVGVR